MSTVQCPHCRGSLEQRPELSLQVVQCPYCAQAFQMPPYQELLVPHAQMPVVSQVAPPNVVLVNTASKREPRLRSRGWFANSMGAAGAFFLCFFLFVVAVCGGGYYWTRSKVTNAINTVAESSKVQQGKWRSIAAAQLANFGYPNVANDAVLSTFRDPDAIVGTCKGKDGRLVDYRIEVKIATFGTEETVEVLSISVDGKELYRQPATNAELPEAG